MEHNDCSVGNIGISSPFDCPCPQCRGDVADFEAHLDSLESESTPAE